MSYILDALRRADSERERGAVPKLFAQPLPRVSAEPGSPLPIAWPWIAAGVIVLALLGAAAWRLMASDGPPPIDAASMPQPPAVAPSVPDTPPAPTLAEAYPPTPLPRQATEPARPVRKPASAPAIVATRSAITTAKPDPATKAAPEASAAEARVYARNELPSEVQRELPTLAIGGASYSESPANRMLIINGQVFHEGDQLAPNLVLEQIKLKAAVLRFKGYRYGVSY